MDCWNDANWCQPAVNWTPAMDSIVWSSCPVCCNSLKTHLNYASISSSVDQHLPILGPASNPPPAEEIQCVNILPFSLLWWLTYAIFQNTLHIYYWCHQRPQQNISIEECLYSTLIVHLLWQTSKSRKPALLNVIYFGRRCFDETKWMRLSTGLICTKSSLHR